MTPALAALIAEAERLDKEAAIRWAPGYSVTARGKVFSSVQWSRHKGHRALTAAPNANGYPSVRLVVCGKRKHVAVHRLVAEAFLPARPSSAHEVRHLDGNKSNPCVSNLAWGTQKENADDRERHGRTARGLRNGVKPALTSAQVSDIRSRHRRGWRTSNSAQLAAEYGVSTGTIHEVVYRRKTYAKDLR